MSECIDQEEHIEKELKLVIKNERNEGEHVVLGIFDDIILIILGKNSP